MKEKLRHKFSFWGNLKYFFVKFFIGKGVFYLKKEKLRIAIDFKENSNLKTAVEIFLLDPYPLPDCEYCQNVKNILDLGANTGLSAVYFSGKCPNAKVDCFEPCPENYEILVKNLYLNKVNSNKYQLAAGSKNKWVSFKSDGVFTSMKDLNNINDGGEAYCIDIFEFIKERKYEIIKIDIEGGEDDILFDDRFLSVAADYVFVEFHSINERNSKESVRRRLEQCGFKVETTYMVNNECGVLRGVKK